MAASVPHSERKGVVVSSKSKQLRKAAAKELRGGRKTTSPARKVRHTRRAAGLKALAAEEEWLKGERERSHKR